jgi:hypothetical protein
VAFVHDTVSCAVDGIVESQRRGRRRFRAIIKRKRTLAAGIPSATPTSLLVKPTEIVEFEREAQRLGQHADRAFEVKLNAGVVARRDAARQFVAEGLSPP